MVHFPSAPPGTAGLCAIAGLRAMNDACPERTSAVLHARAVILDLDGTLIDTAADLAAAVNAMLADAGRPTLPESRVTAYVGKGAEVLVHRALTDSPQGRASPDDFEPAYRSFLEHYRAENGRRAALYPGVLAGLEALRAKRLRLAIVTNKPSAFTGPLLEKCGIAGFFELVICGDTLARRKPDPLPMLHVCEVFGLEPMQMVAIGDSLNDALAARAAGMPVLAVPYGYNEGHDVRSLDVDAIVSSLLEAAGLIESCA